MEEFTAPWSLNSRYFCKVIAVFQLFLFLQYKFFNTCYNCTTFRLISGLTPCTGCWHFAESLSVNSKNKATNKLRDECLFWIINFHYSEEKETALICSKFHSEAFFEIYIYFSKLSFNCHASEFKCF